MENLTKICTKCQKELPLDAFRWKKKSEGRKHSQCKECQSEQEKLHYQERKDKVIENTYSYKERNFQYILERKECGCQKCGEIKHYMLDFHHIDPSQKEANINNLKTSCSLETLKKEIDKCIVLCANCHREFHYLNSHEGLNLETFLQI